MVRVSSKYNPDFVEFLKGLGGKWNPESKTWDVSESRIKEVEAKAKELNVQGFKVEAKAESAQPTEGEIRMKLSRDGRFVLISVDMLAFAEDVKQMLDGKRRSVRFRVLPPKRSI
jgi:hypothetical protein